MDVVRCADDFTLVGNSDQLAFVSGTPIFSYIHMAWTILGVQKNEYFWGFDEFVDIWRGH